MSLSLFVISPRSTFLSMPSRSGLLRRFQQFKDSKLPNVFLVPIFGYIAHVYLANEQQLARISEVSFFIFNGNLCNFKLFLRLRLVFPDSTGGAGCRALVSRFERLGTSMRRSFFKNIQEGRTYNGFKVDQLIQKSKVTQKQICQKLMQSLQHSTFQELRRQVYGAHREHSNIKVSNYYPQSFRSR